MKNQTHNLLIPPGHGAKHSSSQPPENDEKEIAEGGEDEGETGSTNAIIFTPALLLGRTAAHLRT